MKIGLALGGGGAIGFFHIGALKALEKLKLKIDVISGSSIGAIMGGFYALHKDVVYLEKVTLELADKYSPALNSFKTYAASTSIEEQKIFLERSFNFVKDFYLWNLRIIKPHLLDPRPFSKILTTMFKKYRFSDCKIPFIATSVDLIKGEEFLLNQGYLSRAVIASSSIPGFFPAFEWEDRILVDGGALMPLPVAPIKSKDVFIIGINILDTEHVYSQTKNAVDIMFAADRLRHRKILLDNLKETDFLVSPCLTEFSWVDFDRARDLIKKGEEGVFAIASDLTRCLKQAKIRKFFFLAGRG